eukprot:jgi/Picsp_1/4517/NSC_06738-R1_protein fam98a-like
MIEEETATELLERLEELRIGAGCGLNESDLLGQGERRALRLCCGNLVRGLWALLARGGDLIMQNNVRSEMRDLLNLMEDNGTLCSFSSGRLPSEKTFCNLSALDEGLHALAVKFGLPEGQYTRLLIIQFLTTTMEAMVMSLETKTITATAVSSEENLKPCLEVEKSSWIRKLSEFHQPSESLCTSASDAVSSTLEFSNGIRNSLPAGFFDQVISFSELTDEQRQLLDSISSRLKQESYLRRKMMIDRAMVTLKSFSSSEKVRKAKDLLVALDHHLSNAERSLVVEPCIIIEHIYKITKGEMASLLYGTIHGVSNHNSRQSLVKTVRIGDVPDRGGRPEGQSRAASLMPKWVPRKKGKIHVDEPHPGRNQKTSNGNSKHEKKHKMQK